jgi:hypothetical protein
MEELMSNWENVQAWDKFNSAHERLEKHKMDKLESTKNSMATR